MPFKNHPVKRYLSSSSLKKNKETLLDSVVVKLDPNDFKTHKLDEFPREFSDPISVSKDELIKYYTQMQIIRRMEMKADALYKNRMIRGFCHLSIGQQAIPVGRKLNFIFRNRSCSGTKRSSNNSLQVPRVCFNER